MKIASNTKILIALAVAAAFMLGMLSACGSDTSEEEATETTAKATVTAGEAANQDAKDKDQDNAAAKEDAKDKQKEEKIKEGTAPAPKKTVEATDGFTVKDADGTISAVLTNTYVGKDALKKLSEMGENPKDFTEDDPAYTTVLYEYTVDVKEGRLIGDPLSGEPYLNDKKTVIDDYWSYSLELIANKDLSSGDLELDAGSTATGYYVYGLPSDIKEYYEKIYTNTKGKAIWVHHTLK